jgi:hypothetical protein
MSDKTLSRSVWQGARPFGERRDITRVPLSIFIDEYVDDRPHRAVTSNISATGLYMHRVSTRRTRLFGRQTRQVQLELRLPDQGDSIWAHGEIRYDELGFDLVHGTGVRFVEMARGHQRMLRDYLYDYRRRRLEEILALVRRNRYH